MNARAEAGHCQIREARTEDLPTLLEFRLSMMAEITGGQSAGVGEGMRRTNEEWLDEHFGRDFSSLLAELHGRPVASAGLMWFHHPPGPGNPGGREAYILNVYTRPEARGMGVARLLMERLVAQAKTSGAGRIWLRASDAGRPLYESMGFGAGKYMQLNAEPAPPAEPGD
jgi:GNAT superfamily N-acetyltransferase